MSIPIPLLLAIVAAVLAFGLLLYQAGRIDGMWRERRRREAIDLAAFRAERMRSGPIAGFTPVPPMSPAGDIGLPRAVLATAGEDLEAGDAVALLRHGAAL